MPLSPEHVQLVRLQVGHAEHRIKLCSAAPDAARSPWRIITGTNPKSRHNTEVTFQLEPITNSAPETLPMCPMCHLYLVVARANRIPLTERVGIRVTALLNKAPKP